MEGRGNGRRRIICHIENRDVRRKAACFQSVFPAACQEGGDGIGPVFLISDHLCDDRACACIPCEEEIHAGCAEGKAGGIECVAQEVAFIRFSGIVSGKDQVCAFGGIHVTHIDIVCSGGHLPVDQVRIVARLVQRGTETFRFIASCNEAERLHRCLVFTHLERKDDDGYISRIEGKCMETEGIGPADMRLAHVEASAVGSRAAEDETDAAVKGDCLIGRFRTKECFRR